jgi:O-antigen/teichoic acid export membrane protein
MSQAKTLASGTFYLALMNAIQYATAFIFYVVVARVLSPSEVGSFSLLLMVMAVFNTLTLLALNNAVIKYVSESLGRGDEEKAWACSVKAFKLILSVAVPALGACLLASPLLFSYVGVGLLEVSAILASAFVLDLTSYYGAVMYGYCMFKQVSAQNILYTLSTRFLGLSLAFLGLKVLGLSLGFLMGSLATLAYSLLVLRGRAGRSKEGLSLFEALEVQHADLRSERDRPLAVVARRGDPVRRRWAERHGDVLHSDSERSPPLDTLGPALLGIVPDSLLDERLWG